MRKKDKVILEIAKKYLRVETLDARGFDDLDFLECAVWEIKEALEKAFEAGQGLKN